MVCKVGRSEPASNFESFWDWFQWTTSLMRSISPFSKMSSIIPGISSLNVNSCFVINEAIYLGFLFGGLAWTASLQGAKPANSHGRDVFTSRSLRNEAMQCWKMNATRFPTVIDSKGGWGGFPEHSMTKDFFPFTTMVESTDESRWMSVKTRL